MRKVSFAGRRQKVAVSIPMVPRAQHKVVESILMLLRDQPARGVCRPQNLLIDAAVDAHVGATCVPLQTKGNAACFVHAVWGHASLARSGTWELCGSEGPSPCKSDLFNTRASLAELSCKFPGQQKFTREQARLNVEASDALARRKFVEDSPKSSGSSLSAVEIDIAVLHFGHRPWKTLPNREYGPAFPQNQNFSKQHESSWRRICHCRRVCGRRKCSV